MFLTLKTFFKTFDPVIAGDPFQIKVGFFDEIGALKDVTNDPTLTYTILNGANVIIFATPQTIQVVTPGSYRIRFSYVYSTVTYSYDFSFCAVDDTNLVLDWPQIYACLKREEPPGVYSQSTDPLKSLTYVDNRAFSEQVATFYAFLNDQTNNIFPETVDPTDIPVLQAWEEMTTGEFDFYPTTTPNIPELVQFIRNAGYSYNPYNLAFWISKYIYLRTGLEIYVYIEEFIMPYNIDYWILGISQLGINTRLAPGYTPTQRKTCIIHVFQLLANPVPQAVKNEITFLLQRWGRLSVNYVVQYGSEPSRFGLTEDLGNTYNGDPRSVGIVCIRFHNDAVEKTLGLTNPFAPSKLLSIEIIPAIGTYYVSNLLPFEVRAHYLNGYSKYVTREATYENLTPTLFTATSQPNIFLCAAMGLGQIKTMYSIFTATASIQIDNIPTPVWTLGLSRLGIDTILGP